jgi:hypothetical protein
MAAHGHDDINDVQSSYAFRLKSAGEQVRAIINDDMSYIQLIMRVKDGELLSTYETIIEQCNKWDDEHPAPLTAKEKTDAVIAEYKYSQPTCQQLRHTLTDHNHIAYKVETVDVTKNFGGIKATASKTWTDRNLNK